MEIISIHPGNIDQEHICCAIGNDQPNTRRASSKKEWMKARFEEGLVFKRFDQRGKLFIEYMPIETVWKPIEGNNYMVISCLWVSGQFKGKKLSSQLLGECIKDARAKNMDGVAVVTSNKVKPFLTDKKFFLHHGFELVDSAYPYFELLTLKLNKNAESPRFSPLAKNGTCPHPEGFAFIYSNQCPFMEEYTGLLSEVLKRKSIPCKIIHLESCSEAQQWGSPFGTLGMYFNGRFVTHELMPVKKFEQFLETLLQ